MDDLSRDKVPPRIIRPRLAAFPSPPLPPQTTAATVAVGQRLFYLVQQLFQRTFYAKTKPSRVYKGQREERGTSSHSQKPSLDHSSLDQLKMEAPERNQRKSEILAKLAFRLRF